MSDVRINRFELLSLHLDLIGPIRELTSLSFLTGAGPANLVMIMGANGSGKTSVLEGVHTAFAMLAASHHAAYGMDALDSGGGSLQLDVRVRLTLDGRSTTVVLAIVLGADPMFVYVPERLDEAQVDRQVVLIYRRARDGSVAIAPTSDPLAVEVAEAISTAQGMASLTLFGQDVHLPSVLYFPTMRGITRNEEQVRAITRPPNLEYRPAHRFGQEGADWASSIDNLFVWFTWIGDGRAEHCRDMANELVFNGRPKRLAEVDRQELLMMVETDSGRHRIDQLSHGERQLLQLVIRIAANMTRFTVVLIDEAELHLHLVLRRRLMVLLKRWAKDYPGLTFVLSSHQTDMLRVFGPKAVEDGLRKGGFLLKPRQQGS